MVQCIFAIALMTAPRAYSQTNGPLTAQADVPFEMVVPWYNRDRTEVEDEVRLIGTLHVTTRTWAARSDHVDRFALHANAVDIHGTSETTGQRFRVNGSFSFDLRDPEGTFNPDGTFNVAMQPWSLRMHKVDPEPARLTEDLTGSTGATTAVVYSPPVSVPCQRVFAADGTPTTSFNCGNFIYSYLVGGAAPTNYRVVVGSGSACVTGMPCVVPDGATLYNGFTGGYNPPLLGQISIFRYRTIVFGDETPQGVLRVNWHCRTGNQEAPTVSISTGSNLFVGSCRPIYSATEPIEMWAETVFRYYRYVGAGQPMQEITAFTTEKVFTFHMDQRPVDLPPVIQGITVRSAARVADRCPIGTDCVLNDGDILYNGQVGDYGPALSMQLSASDPEGDPLIVEWFCRSGSYFAPITNQGSTSAVCNPGYIYPDPIQVYAKVSDGNNVVWVSQPREFRMLEFIH